MGRQMIGSAPRSRSRISQCHMRPCSRGVLRPSCSRPRHPPEKSRAQGRSGAGLSHGPPATKKRRRQVPQVRPRASRPSLRDGVTIYTRSSWGPAVLPPSFAMMRQHYRKTWHQLRDTRTTRLHRCVGIVRPHGDHAATRHAHRIPHPTSVTTAKRPLFETGCGDQTVISDKRKQKIFLRERLDRVSRVESVREFSCLARQAAQALRQHSDGLFDQDSINSSVCSRD